MPELTAEKIAELKTAHPRGLQLFEVEGFKIVTRLVDMKAYRAFKKRANSPVEKSQTGEGLLFDLLVFPSKEEVFDFLYRMPLAIGEIADEICKEAGALTIWASEGIDSSDNETFTAGDLTVVMEPIKGAVGRLYQARLDDPDLTVGAAEWLLEQVIVSPAWPDLLARVDGRPFVLDRLARIASERAGRAVEVRAKKL